MKVGVIGNTKLTKKGIELLSKLGYNIEYIFGLSDDQREGKVNSVDLTPLSHRLDIPLFKGTDWDSIIDIDVDLIISLGDSRYVPPMVVEKFDVIGNHGAVLPFVQGGASLVWGRMLNNGQWGVSIMVLDKKIDNGTILKTGTFNYTSDISMDNFCEKCDDLTIDLLEDYLLNGADDYSNVLSSINLRVSKHIDSKVGTELLKFCMDNGLNVYMPPRTQSDGLVKDEWDSEFIENFKKANDTPYPKYQ